MKRIAITLTVTALLALNAPTAMASSWDGLRDTSPIIGSWSGVSKIWYTVKAGDTLFSIARRTYGGTIAAGRRYREIMALNHLTSVHITPGQRLRVR